MNLSIPHYIKDRLIESKISEGFIFKKTVAPFYKLSKTTAKYLVRKDALQKYCRVILEECLKLHFSPAQSYTMLN